MGPVDSKNEQFAQTWRALQVVIVLSGLALAASAFYGFQYSTRGAILAVLASLSGYAFGGLIGFLFGFPRYTDNAAVETTADLRDSAGRMDGQAIVPKLRANTNLERIVDWLTTMIVGATLVNLTNLITWSAARFASVTAAIVGTGATTASAPSMTAIPGALLVIPFAVAGFLHLYLWARSVLLVEWFDTERGLAQRVTKIEQRQEEFFTAALDKILRELGEKNVDENLLEDIERRYKAAKTWNDEPIAGFAPQENDGFRLEASITERSRQSPNPFEVRLIVSRVDKKPFRAIVVFLLHHSFYAPVRWQPVDGVEANLTISCSEEFFVGAMVVLPVPTGTKTVALALDLSAVPNIPPGFKATG